MQLASRASSVWLAHGKSSKLCFHVLFQFIQSVDAVQQGQPYEPAKRVCCLAKRLVIKWIIDR